MRVLLSLTLLCVSTFSIAQERDFETYLDGLVAAQFKDYKLAGMTFVMVQGDQITLAKGYGSADLQTGEPVDPTRHLFRPGSVSKLFTWTAVMQLVEQGKLDLNTDVSEYIDQFELPFPEPITLTHIMTHTPGLEDGAAGYLFEESEDDLIPLAEAMERYLPNQVRAPGTHASYSNWATALAGLIVANVSGQSFESYVEEHIFAPLNMPNATFDEPLPDRLAANMATGYINHQGTLKSAGFEFIKNFGPAGALSAASTDIGHFMIAHLNEGRFGDQRILSPETTALMHAQLFRHHESVAATAHGFYESWRNGRRFIGHGGDTIAFHSQLLIDPLNQFGIYLSFNAPDGARARSAIIDGIIDFYYPPEPPRFNFDPIDGTEARIPEVVGAYRLNRRSYTKLDGIVALAGDLTVTPTGDGGLFVPNPTNPGGGSKFFEVEPYVFDQVGGINRVVFTKDANGEVAHALLADVPIIVGDKMGPLETAANHQLVIVLTFLASVFVFINYLRNRKDGLTGIPARGRFLLAGASLTNLIYLIGFGLVFASLDMQRVIYDFPPTGFPIIQIFPFVSLIFTLAALYYLWPVWKAAECNRWESLRYSYVTILFVLFLAVLNYWNLIGWNYYS